MFKELRRIFLVGIFTTAPLGLTLYLFLKLFAWFDALFQPIVHPILRQYFPYAVPGVGFLLGLFVIFFIGLVAPSIVGRQFLNLLERIVERVPLAKWIYSGTKQIFDSFSTTNLNKFNRVVMIQFPQSNTYAIGFVTQELSQSSFLPEKLAQNKLVVFIPTTPNPTSGYIVFVSEQDSIPLTMSVEEALKFIISVGLVRPNSHTPALKTKSF